MQDETKLFNQIFFETLESNIAKLPHAMQEDLYRPCAIHCVQNFVLGEQKRQFAECGGNLDLQYQKYGKSEFFFGEIVEPGHVYEVGYPRCLCPIVESGLSSMPIHCECSRQSILYVLHTLMPEKKIQVETIHTVLSGADECRFRVTVE
jgi:hypothetical protein